MRAFVILFWKELRSFFLTPLAYIMIALFTGLGGFLFAQTIQTMRQNVMPQNLISNMLGSIGFWMIFMILFPIITMRLFAEERRMGTLEGLFTAPVRTSEVVLAKFAATVVLYVVLILPMLFFFPLFTLITDQNDAFHAGAWWGGFLGMLLVGIFNIAIGTLASAVTPNQLIAAMLCFVGVMLHFMVGVLHMMGMMPQSVFSDGLTYVSTLEHITTLSEGLIDSRPVIYYLSFSAVLLTITHHVLEYRKWQA